MIFQKKTTAEWAEFEKIRELKTKLGIYSDVDKNVAMMEGNHWRGLNVQNMPKPQIPAIERAGDLAVSQIHKPVTAVISAENISDMVDENGNQDPRIAYAEILSQHVNTLHDRNDFDTLNMIGIGKAFTECDYLLYTFWDKDKKRFDAREAELSDGTKVSRKYNGEIEYEIVDIVHYNPGNMNEPDVQKQPYIIIDRRELVDSVVREMVANNNISEKEARKRITSDNETEYAAGDAGKKELEDTQLTTITKFWKEEVDGKTIVKARKCTKTEVIREWERIVEDRYPFNKFSWKLRTGCAFGRSEVTTFRPNQVAINKQYGLLQLHAMKSTNPATFYDSNRIKTPPSAVGAYIPAPGMSGEQGKLTQADYPNNLPGEAYNLPQAILDQTMNMLGATSVALADINPTNTSAFIMAKKAASEPLEPIRRRFYAFCENQYYIDLAFIKEYYGQRTIMIETPNGRVPYRIPEDMFENVMYNVEIDVSATTMWDEFAQQQSLDNLRAQGQIPLSLWAEATPDRFMKPNVKQKIIAAALKMEQAQDQMAQQQAQVDQEEQMAYAEAQRAKAAETMMQPQQGMEGMA